VNKGPKLVVRHALNFHVDWI